MDDQAGRMPAPATTKRITEGNQDFAVAVSAGLATLRSNPPPGTGYRSPVDSIVDKLTAVPRTRLGKRVGSLARG
jgi:hypothetical protein